MDEQEIIDERYYAFNARGTKIIAGPFETRLEAARHSKKAGRSCRFCWNFSGGMTICRGCLCIIFENGRRKEEEERKAEAAKKRRAHYVEQKKSVY